MITMMGMILVFYAIVVAILYTTRKNKDPDFNEYAVGGRAYGPWYIAWSYINSWWPGSTFIAFFGMATGFGVFGFYGLAYSTLGVAFMYFMATRAWRWGAAYGLRTQPDLMGKRFNSVWVRRIASFIGVVSLFPWIITGMQALAALFHVASNGHWSYTTSLIMGLAAIVVRQIWTVQMGMRGLIMTDVFQGAVAYGGAALICVLMLLGSVMPRSLSVTSATSLRSTSVFPVTAASTAPGTSSPSFSPVSSALSAGPPASSGSTPHPLSGR
jgi:Na+/proline symporter